MKYSTLPRSSAVASPASAPSPRGPVGLPLRFPLPFRVPLPFRACAPSDGTRREPAREPGAGKCQMGGKVSPKMHSRKHDLSTPPNPLRNGRQRQPGACPAPSGLLPDGAHAYSAAGVPFQPYTMYDVRPNPDDDGRRKRTVFTWPFVDAGAALADRQIELVADLSAVRARALGFAVLGVIWDRCTARRSCRRWDDWASWTVG